MACSTTCRLPSAAWSCRCRPVQVLAYVKLLLSVCRSWSSACCWRAGTQLAGQHAGCCQPPGQAAPEQGHHVVDRVLLCVRILDAVRAAGEPEDGLQDSVQAAFARLGKLLGARSLSR